MYSGSAAQTCQDIQSSFGKQRICVRVFLFLFFFCFVLFYFLLREKTMFLYGSYIWESFVKNILTAVSCQMLSVRMTHSTLRLSELLHIMEICSTLPGVQINSNKDEIGWDLQFSHQAKSYTFFKSSTLTVS